MKPERGAFSVEDSLEALTGLCERYSGQKGSIISILQDVEWTFGFIPQEAIKWVSRRLEIPESRFYGIATFYAQFHLNPRGKNIVTACSGTACHVKGSERVINALRRELNLPDGEETTEDSEFTVEKVNCVGACSIAPVVIINKRVYGKTSSDKISKELKKLKKTSSKEAGKYEG